VYTDADSGLKVHYPDRWMAVPPDQGSDVLQYFFAPAAMWLLVSWSIQRGTNHWSRSRQKSALRS